MALRFQGFAVEIGRHRRGRARRRRATSSPHLMVLDVMLPDMEGFDVAQRLGAAARARADHLPHRPRRDRRTRSAASRSAATTTSPSRSASRSWSRASARSCAAPGLAEPESSRLVFEDLELDEDAHEVTRAGELVELTATEYRLLRYLMLNPRRVLTRAQLLEHVWEYDFGGDARVLETYVSYLRKKLDAHGPPLIHTVRGVGYALRAAARRDGARCGPGSSAGLLALAARRAARARRRSRTPSSARSSRARRPAGARGARRRGRRARAARLRVADARRRAGGPAGRAARAGRRARRGLPPGTYGERRDADGKVVGDVVLGYGDEATARPGAARRPARSAQLFTVDGRGGTTTATACYAERDRCGAGTVVAAVPLQRGRPDARAGCCSSRRS